MKRSNLKNNTQHVIPLGNGWAVMKENAKDLFIITEKQRDAIYVARKLAQSSQSELVIHGKKGEIRKRVSYVSSPSIREMKF